MTREHGTYAKYRGDRCRCDPCREAASAQKRKWRTKPDKRRPRPELPHGVYAKYRGGCRCDECRAAARERARTWTENLAAKRRLGVDLERVGEFVDGLRDWTTTTSEERRLAAWHLDRAGVSRGEIARRTRLNSRTLYAVYALEDDPMTGYRYESPNGVALWAKLHVPHPGVDDIECKSRHDLFADWLEGNTRHLMRHGAPDVWAQRYIGEALAVCARCPVREWCVTATKPQQSRVAIIAGGSVWHDGVEVWTLAQQEALEAAQDADREDAVA